MIKLQIRKKRKINIHKLVIGILKRKSIFRQYENFELGKSLINQFENNFKNKTKESNHRSRLQMMK